MAVSRVVATVTARPARALASSLLVQRSRAFRATAPQLGGGGAEPPLPPFARSPRRTEPMAENSDALWDDGVAPELALDFDAPDVSSREALYTLLGAFVGFGVLYLGIQWATSGALDDNPAFSHATDCIDQDYSNHALTPLPGDAAAADEDKE